VARRGFPRAAALVAILFLVLAGVNVPARAQVEVRMWTLLSGGDGARMRALVDDFNASQRDVRVISFV
jgi:multiple sugar transport system substrate-binding protein